MPTKLNMFHIAHHILSGMCAPTYIDNFQSALVVILIVWLKFVPMHVGPCLQVFPVPVEMFVSWVQVCVLAFNSDYYSS